ncbi:MAG: hypothetical protein ACE14L_03695 [Terriglobales bacterium]
MRRKALVSLLCLLLLIGAAALWARDDHMINSTLVPAAKGNVHTDTDRNGNTGVRVEVEHLAKPHDLKPSYDAYVTWIRPRGEEPLNVGELRVNDELKGPLQTNTPYKQFDVFVTAENDARVTQPSGPEVLRATVNRD